MPAHRFAIGKIVAAKPDRFGLLPPGAYEIVRLLPPAADGIYQYRIKAVQGGQERVVKESDLSVEGSDAMGQRPAASST